MWMASVRMTRFEVFSASLAMMNCPSCEALQKLWAIASSSQMYFLCSKD